MAKRKWWPLYIGDIESLVLRRFMLLVAAAVIVPLTGLAICAVFLENVARAAWASVVVTWEDCFEALEGTLDSWLSSWKAREPWPL